VRAVTKGPTTARMTFRAESSKPGELTSKHKKRIHTENQSIKRPTLHIPANHKVARNAG